MKIIISEITPIELTTEDRLRFQEEDEIISNMTKKEFVEWQKSIPK